MASSICGEPSTTPPGNLRDRRECVWREKGDRPPSLRRGLYRHSDRASAGCLIAPILIKAEVDVCRHHSAARLSAGCLPTDFAMSADHGVETICHRRPRCIPARRIGARHHASRLRAYDHIDLQNFIARMWPASDRHLISRSANHTTARGSGAKPVAQLQRRFGNDQDIAEQIAMSRPNPRSSSPAFHAANVC
jgi:hypothetical protein